MHSGIQNRSGRDRRRLFDVYCFTKDGTKTSILNERRSQSERRKGWAKVSQWGSVCEEQKNPKLPHR
jgi:hypothetical protein